MNNISNVSDNRANGKDVDAPTTEAAAHSEGIVARTIEEQTAKLPSDIFLWGAIGSLAISLFFKVKGDAENSRFVGQWVSPFLLLGVYNKIVKVGGSDRLNAQSTFGSTL